MGAILLVAIVGGAIYIFSGGGRQKKPGYFATKDKVIENQRKTRNYLMRIGGFYLLNADLEEIERIIKNKGKEAKTELEKKLLRYYCNEVLEEVQEKKDALEQAEKDIYISEEERRVLLRYIDFDRMPDPGFIESLLYTERERLERDIAEKKKNIDKAISKAKELKDIFGIEEIKDSEEDDDEIEEEIVVEKSKYETRKEFLEELGIDTSKPWWFFDKKK